MSKINNFVEANNESLTVEEKLFLSQAFIRRRLKCQKFALQLDCYESIRPPSTGSDEIKTE